MSYMRGEYYVYEGDDGFVICTKDGYITIPSLIFNALVMMRVSELTKEEKVEAVKFAIKNYSGNFGVDPLRKRCGLETTFEAIKKIFEKPVNKKSKVKEVLKYVRR